MKRLLILLVVALALAGCKIGVDGLPAARSAAIEEQATATVEGLICVTVTPTPCMVCPTCPAAGPTPTATPVATATAGPVATVQYDPRVFAMTFGDWTGPLNVKVTTHPDDAFVLEQVFITWNGVFDGAPPWAWEYVGVEGAGAATNAFMVVKHADGSRFAGKNGVLTWADGQDMRATGADGSVEWFTNSKYDPRVTGGPYCFGPNRGTTLCGAGLPFGQHVSVWGVWKALAQ